MKTYPQWATDLLTLSEDERWEIMAEIGQELAENNKSKEGVQFVNFLSNTKLFRLVGFSTNIEFVMIDKNNNQIQNLKFRQPFAYFFHKKLPLIIITNDDINDHSQSSFDYFKGYEGPRERLGWVKTFLNSSFEKKKMWLDVIIDGIKSYRKTNKSNQKFLSEAITDKSEYEILGLATNLQYIRVSYKKDPDLLNYIFIHPWGTPPLLLKHKRLPFYMIAGPSIRLDDSILNELKQNGYNKNIIGATG